MNTVTKMRMRDRHPDWADRLHGFAKEEFITSRLPEAADADKYGLVAINDRTYLYAPWDSIEEGTLWNHTYAWWVPFDCDEAKRPSLAFIRPAAETAPTTAACPIHEN